MILFLLHLNNWNYILLPLKWRENEIILSESSEPTTPHTMPDTAGVRARITASGDVLICERQRMLDVYKPSPTCIGDRWSIPIYYPDGWMFTGDDFIVVPTPARASFFLYNIRVPDQAPQRLELLPRGPEYSLHLAHDLLVYTRAASVICTAPGQCALFRFSSWHENITLTRVYDGGEEKEVCVLHNAGCPVLAVASRTRVACLTDKSKFISWTAGGVDSQLSSPPGSDYRATVHMPGTMSVRTLPFSVGKSSTPPSFAIGSEVDIIVITSGAFIIPHLTSKNIIPVTYVGRRFSFMTGAQDIAIQSERPGMPWEMAKLLFAGFCHKNSRSVLNVLPLELFQKILLMFTCVHVASVCKFSLSTLRWHVTRVCIQTGVAQVEGKVPAPSRRADMRRGGVKFMFAK
jgi:hypothetical protein